MPPFLPPSSLLQLVHSSAPFPRYHVFDPFGPFLPVPLRAWYHFRAIAHTSSYDVSLLVSESLCVILASCVSTFPRSIGTGPSSDIISLMMISSFSMISSNFFGPVKNSRLMSFGISVATNVFCASSTRFELMLVLGHFHEHAVSLSFNSFASWHPLGVAIMGCSAFAGSFDDLGA